MRILTLWQIYRYKQNEKHPWFTKNTHSSHARPKTKTSDQLVGIADYMGTSLEVNDDHTMHMYVQQMHMCHNDQAYKLD